MNTSKDPHGRWALLAAVGTVALATVLAYHNGLSGDFVFDAIPATLDNPSIRRLWPIWNALSPPLSGVGVVGRPIANLSLAVSYALSGSDVWGYHVLNLLLHVLSAVTLFAIVRRTLLTEPLVGRYGKDSLPLSVAVAALWAVHPLQTLSVTYTAQRTECVMGLFYLLTLYCFLRGTKSPKPRTWFALAVTACFLGMGSKEVMVSAPLMVLAYDRTFVARSWAGAWRARWRLYLGLGSSWILLGWLMLGTQQRAGAAGFGLGMTWWEYARTQGWAVVHYLGLAFWPGQLVFDYGDELVRASTDVTIAVLIVAGLLVGTGVALVRRPRLGFVGAWFFAILAPTSSVVPLTLQPVAENRVYLSLASVVAGVVLLAYRWAGRRTFPVLVGLAACLVWRTVRRNEDYRTALALWSDTAQKVPESYRAHLNLGVSWLEKGKAAEAIGEYRKALEIRPTAWRAHANLGTALLRVNRAEAALAEYDRALTITPDAVSALNGKANALVALGRLADATAAYRRCLELAPDFANARYGLARVQAITGKLREAIEELDRYLEGNPDDVEASSMQGGLLARTGRTREALAYLEQATRTDPNYAPAHYNLAGVYWQLGRPQPAMAEYREVLRLSPDHYEAHLNLGNLLFAQSQAWAAVEEYERALRIDPKRADAHLSLGFALARLGNAEPAKRHYARALELDPGNERARRALEQLE